MSSDQMPAPGMTKLIKFPPSRAGKDVKCLGYARGVGGMFKLRFDRYISVNMELKHRQRMGRRRRNNDVMSRKISRAGFVFGGKNEKLSKGLRERKPLKFRFKMTSFKDIQTLLPLFHDDGLIDDDEFLLLYDLYSSTNPDLPCI